MPPEQNRPASPKLAPDPFKSYERSHPDDESGMGRLDNNKGTPSAEPDRQNDAVKNRQDATKQVNGQDIDIPPAEQSDVSK